MPAHTIIRFGGPTRGHEMRLSSDDSGGVWFRPGLLDGDGEFFIPAGELGYALRTLGIIDCDTVLPGE